jgi:ATP-dependent DNA helicase RecG
MFRKDVFKDDYLRKLGLNERQIAAVAYLKEHGSITNAEYQKLGQVKRRQATNELGELVEQDVVKRAGRVGRGVVYRLKPAGNGHNAH